MKRAFGLPQPSAAASVIWLRRVLGVAAALALVAICLEYGFERPPLPVSLLVAVQLFAAGVFVLALAAAVVTAPRKGAALRRRWYDILLILGCLLVLGAEVAVHGEPLAQASSLYVSTLQVALLARFAIGAVRFNLRLARGRLSPGGLMALSFLVVIIVGGLLLALPKATAPELRHEEGDYFYKRLLNCMFTSVSATCVTGLTVYDTGKDFTRFGQIVIVVLIQVGGLGTMIFGGMFGILAGRQLSLRESLALRDATSHQTLGEVRKMVVFVMVCTFGCELVGAALLYPMWKAEVGPATERIFYSLFHAVAAFCNAGFALPRDNLVPYRGAWQVYASIMPLIVIGGLGFPVLFDLYRALRSRLARSSGSGATDALVVPRSRVRGRSHPLSLHTKLVLVSTAVLIVGGALGLFLFESRDWRGERRLPPEVAARMPPAMVDLPPAARAAAALFQSVTPRTAGFNVVGLDPGSFSTAGAFLTMLLMFIGGSPAGTAGGVKTVSVATLFLGAYAVLRGRTNVEGFRRTIPLAAVRRAGMVVALLFTFICLMTLLLCVTERGESLLEIQFELVSACGTVGLSTGLTTRLTVAGRFLIMLAMFVGRVGPVTLLVALTGRASPARYDYPEEQPVIG